MAEFQNETESKGLKLQDLLLNSKETFYSAPAVEPVQFILLLTWTSLGDFYLVTGGDVLYFKN